MSESEKGLVKREEFGATQLQRSGETAIAAVAAQAQSMIQARYVMALRRPRDLDEVRVKLLKACERPGFAESAWYRKPVGKGVEGLTIRFAEEASRCMTNISKDAMVVYEDDDQRIVRVFVSDLEANDCNSLDVVVTKTVERSKVPAGETPLRVRTNAAGNPTFILRATDDDVLVKQQSLLSRIRRNLILQVLPGDIVDEAKARIKEIRLGDAAKDPEGAKKKVADAFAGIGVMPADLKKYLGHELAACSPAEIVDLRAVFTAIKTGESTWQEIISGRTGEEIPTTMDAAKERLRAAAPAVLAEAPPSPNLRVDTVTPIDPTLFREPGQDDDEAPNEVPLVVAVHDAQGCYHVSIHGRAVPQGKTVVCHDCKADVNGVQLRAAEGRYANAKGGK